MTNYIRHHSVTTKKQIIAMRAQFANISCSVINVSSNPTENLSYIISNFVGFFGGWVVGFRTIS